MIYTTIEPGSIHYFPVSHKRSAFGIWGRVFGFYIEHWAILLAILPLLFLPVFTDALHTLLIQQHVGRRALRMGGSLRQALETTMPLLGVKWAFWWRSTLWGIIPLIGSIKGAQLRVARGMASNVMLLECASDELCRMRSEDLSRHSDRGLLVRTLVTIPALLHMIIIVLCVMGEQLVGGGWLLVFWIVFALWIVIPASAAANTFAYLEVASEQRLGESR